MKSHFTSDFFTANRAKLRELANSNLVVITAHGLLQRNSDMPMAFRQDSNFWYLTGITEPDVVLVMDDRDEYLIVPTRDAIRQAFDGSIEGSDLSDRSGITEIYDAEAGWQRLAQSLKTAKTVGTLSAPPAYIEHYAFYTNPARANLIQKLKAHNSELQAQDLKDAFIKLRVIKQPVELRAIEASIDLTVKTLTGLHSQLSTLHHEYEIEAYITKAFRHKNAKHGYTPIIASGGSACTLHYEANDAKLAAKDLLLVDVGAEAEYYSADITRTFAIGVPTKRQVAVFDAVAAVQDFAFSLLRPGVTIRENEKKIEAYMGERLIELGLIKVIDHDSVRQYYPHATSHFLGLDVHDAGDYDAPLQAGMVLTVEPGIYIPEENIGVRIEDNILITEDGYKNLSKKLPRSLG
jgi:Xaa-Pro aminopeptidase